MKSKHYFSQFKKEIDEEIRDFKAYDEKTTMAGSSCTHKGKVKWINGSLRCVCGAAWTGSQLNVLADYFKE